MGHKPEVSSVSTSSDESDSDSSSSSSVNEEQLSDLAPVAGGASASSATLASPGARAAPSLLALPRRGMACGKMLVRSGLRCACHFSYLEECPDKMPIAGA